VEVGRWKYYPFGQETETGNGFAPRHRFTGHERDGEVSLDYMRARYSSSSLARFTTVDRSQAGVDTSRVTSLNLYQYVRNTPVNAVDPSGLAELLISAADQQKVLADLQKVAGPGITLNGRTLEFDDAALGQGADYSPQARAMLKELASPDTPGTVEIGVDSRLLTPPGVTKTVPADTLPMTASSPKDVQGPMYSGVVYTGQMSLAQGASSRQRTIAGPAGIVLMHELVHALNGLRGFTPSVGRGRDAVSMENVFRQELGMWPRALEPDHVE
jgi:RHS repeat-associated protein